MSYKKDHLREQFHVEERDREKDLFLWITYTCQPSNDTTELNNVAEIVSVLD